MVESNGENVPIPKKLLQIIRDRVLSRETNRLKLELSAQAAERLRRLVLRDNPNLAEFPFLGLGQGYTVNDIWVVNESSYSKASGLGLLRGGFMESQTDEHEIKELFRRIIVENRLQDFILFGHLHPSGEASIGGVRYILDPSETLLIPSSGDSAKGGIVSEGDLGFYSSFLRLNPTLSPYAAIAANTQQGPKLRVYDMHALGKIKRYSDLEKVPQITLQL